MVGKGNQICQSERPTDPLFSLSLSLMGGDVMGSRREGGREEGNPIFFASVIRVATEPAHLVGHGRSLFSWAGGGERGKGGGTQKEISPFVPPSLPTMATSVTCFLSLSLSLSPPLKSSDLKHFFLSTTASTKTCRYFLRLSYISLLLLPFPLFPFLLLLLASSFFRVRIQFIF